MNLLMCLPALLALTTQLPTRQSVSHRSTSVRSPSTDSAAIIAIGDELRAYYRDLHDRNWTSIVTHFYPAKVTARFAVPDTEPAWVALVMPESDTGARADAHGYCAPSVAIAIVGKWARVRTRRCTGERDEAWFYVMSGKWKIIHLESGQALAT